MARRHHGDGILPLHQRSNSSCFPIFSALKPDYKKLPQSRKPAIGRKLAHLRLAAFWKNWPIAEGLLWGNGWGKRTFGAVQSEFGCHRRAKELLQSCRVSRYAAMRIVGLGRGGVGKLIAEETRIFQRKSKHLSRCHLRRKAPN
jgi:hypothetical protein